MPGWPENKARAITVMPRPLPSPPQSVKRGRRA